MSVTPIWIGSPNSRVRIGTVRFITLHWMVGNLRGTDQIFQKVHGTATHYGIENGVIHQYVKEERSAPGTGSNLAIPYDITIEHAGGWLLPDGSRFKPSEATHETSAQLCADISRRHGLGKLVVGVNVFPHKHFVATACPGSLDLEWIARRANELLGNPAAPASTPAAAPGRLVEDGVLGTKTIFRWQEVLGTVADGVISTPKSQLVTAVQRRINGAGYTPKLVVDGAGIWQNGRPSKTITGLQWYLGTPRDGKLSKPSSTAVRALQVRLNAGRF